MHAAEVIAYTYEGEIFCEDCKPIVKDNESEDEIGVVFADQEDTLVGYSCASCRSYWDSSWGGWLLPET